MTTETTRCTDNIHKYKQNANQTCCNIYEVYSILAYDAVLIGDLLEVSEEFSASIFRLFIDYTEDGRIS